MRKSKLKQAFQILSLFLFSLPFSNLNSQTKLVGVIENNDVSNIFFIETDGSNYLEINPCEPDNCSGYLFLNGFNNNNEILGVTSLGGDNGFGKYMKASINEVSTIRHFEEEKDVLKFSNVIKSEEGDLFATTCFLENKNVYHLNEDGSNDELFFNSTSESILEFQDGKDGYFYASGIGQLYRVDKSTLDVSVLRTFANTSPIISIGYNIAPPIDGEIFGIASGYEQGPNGSSYPFRFLFKMQSDGSEYVETNFHPLTIIPDYQNQQLFLIYQNSIVASNLDLTDSMSIKFFDELSGLELQSIIIGEDQKMYGTTKSGGSFGFGTLFKMEKDGTNFTILKHFEKSHRQLLEQETEINNEVEEIVTVEELIIYPNPTSDQLFIEYSNPKNEPVEIFVFSELGKQVLFQTKNEEKTELSISSLATGVYYLKIVYPLSGISNSVGRFIKR